VFGIPTITGESFSEDREKQRPSSGVTLEVSSEAFCANTAHLQALLVVGVNALYTCCSDAKREGSAGCFFSSDALFLLGSEPVARKLWQVESSTSERGVRATTKAVDPSDIFATFSTTGLIQCAEGETSPVGLDTSLKPLSGLLPSSIARGDCASRIPRAEATAPEKCSILGLRQKPDIGGVEIVCGS
jgi:hypothetical protein